MHSSRSTPAATATATAARPHHPDESLAGVYREPTGVAGISIGAIDFSPRLSPAPFQPTGTSGPISWYDTSALEVDSAHTLHGPRWTAHARANGNVHVFDLTAESKPTSIAHHLTAQGNRS